jgi:hypothetical protein
MAIFSGILWWLDPLLLLKRNHASPGSGSSNECTKQYVLLLCALFLRETLLNLITSPFAICSCSIREIADEPQSGTQALSSGERDSSVIQISALRIEVADATRGLFMMETTTASISTDEDDGSTFLFSERISIASRIPKGAGITCLLE